MAHPTVVHQDDLQSIWLETLLVFQRRLARPSFETWLGETKALGVEASSLVVRFSNEFARDWVAARYQEELNAILQSVSGRPWTVRMVVAGSTGQERPSTPMGTAGPLVADAPAERPPRASVHDRLRPSEHAPSPEPPATGGARPSSRLNPKYRFETFVVGPSNEFAHAAALAASEAPGEAYNPLFLYGGVGLGKTHLMQAIGHYVLRQHHDLSVVYVSSETFTNDLIRSLGRKAMVDFRAVYRTVDVLLVDDIQFVAGKESTQEEFFHTFNALYEAGRQIVISSDRPPKEIPTLEERLRSRFEWGLTADIQPPDFETRTAILRRKALAENLHLPDEVLNYIASQVDSNIRELEGALIKVVATASLRSCPVTLEVAAEALKDLVRSAQPRPTTIAAIQRAVADYFGLTVDDLVSKRRTRNVTMPRQIAMFLARELTDASLPRIGEEFGGRDHTTVIHACEKIRAEQGMDPSLARALQEIHGLVDKV
ncbi:chromosomal replication initiator protein DnaA [Limnochorda pilosa]|uniref:Chromosomal replication initiator protein DnaA n=1 Tax=Limnochorda pilosa TaxID=1555112 RepID=A0A0K2SFQ3_LIMPI|nr:chromosomal replication initiator protein DnaA [Limnochorda pilosa]BAS25862.1 chromosomal replication initiator protein DnaA [Limnochorda pilosa]